MMELLGFYLFAFILCLVVPAVLTIQGTHLVARKQGLEVLALSQFALLGTLFGTLYSHKEGGILPLAFSLIFFINGRFIIKKLSRSLDSKESFYVTFFLISLCASHWLVMYFPALDAHMTSGVFGDIVTIPIDRTKVLIGIFSLLAIISFFFHKEQLRVTFEKSFLGLTKSSTHKESLFIGVIIILSLFELGLVYTIGILLLPSVLLSGLFKSFKVYAIVATLVSTTCTVLGLFFSLYFQRISTVPTQILLLFFTLLLIRLIFSKLSVKS